MSAPVPSPSMKQTIGSSGTTSSPSARTVMVEPRVGSGMRSLIGSPRSRRARPEAARRMEASAQEGADLADLVGVLPGETRTAEVPVGGGATVDRAQQVEVLHEARRL